MFRRFSFVQHTNIKSFSISSSSINLYVPMKKLIDEEKYQEALNLFDRNSVSASHIVIPLALKACTKLRNLERGIIIHQQLSSQSINNSFISTSLIHLYMTCGDEDNAYRVFNRIKNKTSDAYGAMFKGFITNKKPEKVFELFDQMLIEPNDVTLNILFSACAKLPNEHALKIKNKYLDQMPKLFASGIYVLSSFLHMLMSFGDISNAENVFAQIKTKNIVTYGVLMKGYLDNKMFAKTLDLFEQMPFDPDEIILIILFKTCSQLVNERTLQLGRKYFNQMPKEFYKNPALLTSTLHMLMTFGDVINAEDVVAQIKTKKNIVTYGVLMKGYLHNKMFAKTLDLFEQMPFDPNQVILTILFKTCSQLVNERTLKLGRKYFNQMPKEFYKNPALLTSTLHMLMTFGDVINAEQLFIQIDMKTNTNYGAMMDGYNMNNEPEKCLNLFNQMQQNNIPLDETIFILALGACSRIGLISICQSTVDKIPSYLLNDHRLQNILIDMWGKAGLINKALEIFEHVQKPDTVTYTTMLNAFGLNGMGHEAVDLYRRMPVDFKSRIADICVLNACSHSGLIDEAHSIFNEIQVKTEKIVTTMVDCMSRMFMFDQAQKLIDNYELSNPPYIIMYMALLSGARNHRNFQLSQKIFDRMKHLFPDKKQTLISGSVLLSNTYSSMGEDERAKQVRFNQLQKIGKKDVIGMSWTAPNGQLAKFKAHDHTHPQSKRIYEEIAHISSELIENGHLYDARWITRELGDGETIDSVLCGHSEKLALAFNFIQDPIPNVIQISKNLRICGDCHSSVKLIAKLRQRPIIIRDASRLHHFNINGQCSCQDHF